MSEYTPMPRWKKSAGAVALLIILLGTIAWLASRPDASSFQAEPILPSTHPQFGPVFETTAVHGTPVRVPNAPSIRPMVSLTIGPGLMQWIKEEINGKPAGYLYLWDPFTRTSNVWSFAACTKSNLAQVTKADLQASFCSADEDEKGRAAFGQKWIRSQASYGARSTALWVMEGDVVLARHVARPSTIYVLEMTKQYRDSLRVRYVEVPE